MSIYEAALRQNRRRRQNQVQGQIRTSRVSLPPPLKGLNTRAPINQLGVDEASELVNLIADAGEIHLREGSTLATPLGVPADRILVYSYLSSDRLLILLRGTPYYTMVWFDSTAHAMTLGAGGTHLFFNANISATMFNGYMVVVNGAQYVQVVYGSGANQVIEAANIMPFANSETFSGVKTFKNRLYFWGREFGFWYLPVNAISGTATFFPLYSVAQSGGSITSINSWTRDSGAGVDDYLVVTTSKGEVIVYQGADPSDPNDWALVGRYQIGRPMSQRGFLELDGKIIVITETDLEVLPDKFLRQQVLSKISRALRDNIRTYSQIGGYRLFYDSTNDRVLATIPTGTNSNDDLVRTAIGYTRFSGINSGDYGVANGALYFARDSYLFRAGGYRDFRNTALVSDISFSGTTGYQMLGGGGEKRVSAYRPKMRSAGSITLTTALSFDQSGVYLPSQTITSIGAGTSWGSPWGSGWDTSGSDRNDWLVGCGSGQSVSMRISGSTRAGLEWSGIDYECIPGGRY